MAVDALRRLERAVPWLVRALWAALPFTSGPALADALHGASAPVRLVASLGLWAGWAVGLAAAAIPHPLSLTALRSIAPAALAAVVAAAVAGHPSPLALGWTAVAVAWCFAPSFGASCVNGPAYPNERRYLLRAPGPLLAGPLALAWAMAAAGVATGPLLISARQWIAGTAALVVGLGLAVVLLRSLHGLSRRWVVFVPAGLVLHDPLTLADPVLFRRQSIESLRPAPAGSDSLDLTQRSPGLALELLLVEPVDLTLVKPGSRRGQPGKSARLLFTPTRPGALLDDAGSRRLPVG